MATKQGTTRSASLQAIIQRDGDWAREVIRRHVREMLAREMTELVGATKSERTRRRLGTQAGLLPRRASFLTRRSAGSYEIPAHLWFDRKTSPQCYRRAATGHSRGC